MKIVLKMFDEEPRPMGGALCLMDKDILDVKGFQTKQIEVDL